MSGFGDESLEIAVGHREGIHPEAIDAHAMRRRFLGIMAVRAHHESAAWNPGHAGMRGRRGRADAPRLRIGNVVHSSLLAGATPRRQRTYGIAARVPMTRW